MNEVMMILGKDINARDFLDMNINKLPGLNKADLNRLKQLNDMLRPLRKLDLEDFLHQVEDDHDERKH